MGQEGEEEGGGCVPELYHKHSAGHFTAGIGVVGPSSVGPAPDPRASVGITPNCWALEQLL